MQIVELHYRFGNACLFKGLNAHFSNGIIGISGANGCGKSTLLRILAGICRPDKGSIKVEGKDLYAQAATLKKSIGYVPSLPFLYGHLTVEENLFLVAMLRHMTKNTFQSNLPIVLEQCQLSALKKVLFGKCSDGVKRRIMLATALINNPKYLILDEPCATLSPQSREALWKVLVAYSNQGNNIILSSHHLEEAATLCTQCYILQQGQLMLCPTKTFTHIILTQNTDEFSVVQQESIL